MIRRRYAFIVADRATGAIHRFTISIGLALIAVTVAVGLPLGWVLHAGWETHAELLRLRLSNARLEIENSGVPRDGDRPDRQPSVAPGGH